MIAVPTNGVPIAIGRPGVRDEVQRRDRSTAATIASATPSPTRDAWKPSDGQGRPLLCPIFTRILLTYLSACSLSDAATLLATRPCDLLLIDLTAPPAADPFAAVHALRDHAAPRPVGLLTTWTLSAAEAERQGFAFLAPMPFDLDRLLLAVAARIAQPLSPDQERQAHVVRRYFAALEARD